MNKEQRLRNSAEGFMAALVANGFRGPWRWRNLDWELPFYRAWREWPPPQRDPNTFPQFKTGGSGRASQGRDMLFRLKRTSPFHDYERAALTASPHGLPPTEYLETYVDGASPQEWISLAAHFLREIDKHPA